MGCLEKIKKYIKKHTGSVGFATSLGLGALGLYLTNAPDVFVHLSDYVAHAYVLDGIAVIVPAKNPQYLRVLTAYVSAILTAISPLVGKVFQSDKE